MWYLLFEGIERIGLKARQSCRKNALAWLGALLAFTASGHPEYSAQVEAITARIEQEPANAQLYLHRADLRRQAGQLEAAFSDVATASRLKRDWPRVSLVRGQIQFDAGNPAEAFKSVQRFLDSETNHAPAWLLRARCHRQLDQPELAIVDYDTALRFFAQPNPDIFIERARLASALGRFDSAIAGLEEGMRRVGMVPGLQLAAVELERKTGQFDAALRRIEEMTKTAIDTRETLLLRAEVLEQAGRLDFAGEVFQQVIKLCKEAPRQNGLIEGMQQNAEKGLNRIKQRLAQK